MPRPTIRTKMISLFVTLIAIAFLSAMGAVLVATEKNIERQTRSKLEVGEKVLLKLMALRGQSLLESARVLTADFGFKAAVSDNDKATIQSALENHGSRIGADLMLLSTLDGKLVAGAGRRTGQLNTYPFMDVLATASTRDGLITMAVLNHRIYKIVLIPVRAPIPIAWATLGFEVDEAFVSQLKALTQLDVTLTGVRQGDPSLSYTSTIPDISLWIDELANQFDTQMNWASSSHNQESLLHFKTTLLDAGPMRIDGILTASKTDERSRFQQLQTQLILISLVTLIASVLIAVLVSNSVSRPLQAIVDATLKISGGNYTHPLEAPKNASRELDDLTTSIQVMQQEIARRIRLIEYQARHDTLTGLPNRTKVLEDLDQRIADADTTTRLGIIEINLNHFKQVNDTFGLQTGDQLLQAVAERLNTLADDQGMTARLGGDEFVVVLVCTETCGFDEVIQKLTGLFSRKFLLDNVEVITSARFGIAQYPEHGTHAEQLLRRANIALSLAKDRKVSIQFYEEGMDIRHLKTITLLNDLKSAIEQDHLQVHYQPKLDLGRGIITQAEALLRWQHPEHGFISPGEFIPLAEQSGLMPELTRWVIQRVIRDVALWKAEGIRVTAAINLSAHDLTYDALPADVHQWVQAANLSPADLMLEVTESAVLEDPEYAVGILKTFRSCGFSLSIDDYGTGYSSLSQLKKLPVDELKIDMSFIRHLDQDKDDQIIVKSTIDMAREFSLSVVAEGVENQASWALLRKWGCHKLQGYYISRPLPLASFLEWLAQFNAKAIEPATEDAGET